MASKMLIGVITTECCSDYQSEIMRGIISQAFRSSCDVAVLSSTHTFYFESVHKNTEKNIFSLILSDQFDGFLYDRNCFYNEKVKRYIDELCTRSGKPVMLIDYADHSRFETTMADDIDAFEAITDHLIEVHGYKKIYCLTGPKGSLYAEERLKGYLRSMKKHGLHVDRSCCRYGDFWVNSAAEFARDIVCGNAEMPEAVVCGNDVMAAALSEKLINAGIRVPADIAVTGYDASMESYRSAPSITSYRRPNFQLGAEAFRRLYRIIKGKICAKVPNEPGELRIGESCGCKENPVLKRDIQHKLKIGESFQERMLYSDMLVDVTNVGSLSALMDRIDSYTHLIYKMSRLYICITESFDKTLSGSAAEKLELSADTALRTVLDKSAVQRNSPDGKYRSVPEILDEMRLNRKQPSVFYITPLHYNGNIFGFSAVSFGKNPITYSRLYIQWINYVNIALEQVRIKSAAHSANSSCGNKTTGISDFHRDFSRIAAAPENAGKTLFCIYLELTELKELYFRLGSAEAEKLVQLFERALKDSLFGGEIFGTAAPGCFAAIVSGENRADEIVRSLKTTLVNCGAEEISFSAGSCSFTASAGIKLSDVIHKAESKKLRTFSARDSETNPQGEKLRQLRERMMKNPELNWNISEISDSMFISKSYLQKIYKARFGRSIIEELIQFRLDKAKKLLTGTNLTVSEIASDCGYSTYNYFVRQFKTAEKLSPTEYREKHRR